VIIAGLTMVDFQRLRRSTDIGEAPLMAASIFLDILNVFLFFTAPHNGGVVDPADRLAVRRAETVALIDALGRRLDGIIESSAFSAADDEHDPEGVTVAFERAQVAGLRELARAELRALDEAGDRLAAGTYGRCVRCGQAIAAERLDALPAASTCIRCADRR
jgi:DnaK suppressor protein